MIAIYINALILGLASSVHCLGMCGPLVLAVPIKEPSKKGQLIGMTQYGIGKTTTYALLGLLVGFVGVSVQMFQWMQVLSILCGIVIIIFAWEKYIKLPFSQKLQQKYLRVSSNLLGKLFRSNLPFKPLFYGAINGLLPCGLIYIALINSLVAGSPLHSALSMICFGIGTLPILFAVKFIGKKIQFKSNRIVPIIITIVGLLIILRGLNLGIPYLSPKIEIPASNDKEMTMSCCSEKDSCEL